MKAETSIPHFTERGLGERDWLPQGEEGTQGVERRARSRDVFWEIVRSGVEEGPQHPVLGDAPRVLWVLHQLLGLCMVQGCVRRHLGRWDTSSIRNPSPFGTQTFPGGTPAASRVCRSVAGATGPPQPPSSSCTPQHPGAHLATSEGSAGTRAGFCSPNNTDHECRREGPRSAPASSAEALPVPGLVDGVVQSDDIITVSITD